MPTWTYGMFVWRELSTGDVDGALRFYGELAGWKSKRIEMPNGAYYLLFKGERQVGGLMALATGADMPPYWMSYLSVPNVDAAVSSSKRLGGEVVWGPIDVENIGRMATIVDPRGGAFSVMKGRSGDPGYRPAQPGEFFWEQLASNDLPTAREFYGEVAGWNAIEQEPRMVAASEALAPGWITSIVVDELGPACQRAVRLGARVLSVDNVVPGIGTYAVIEDPQGARIGLFK